MFVQHSLRRAHLRHVSSLPPPGLFSFASHSSKPRTHLEVEHKFVPTAAFMRCLVDGAQEEAEPSLPYDHASTSSALKGLVVTRLRDRQIRDTYLDADGKLVCQGIWVRRRAQEDCGRETACVPLQDGQGKESWQAKVRLSGDFVDSQFEEIEGQGQVTKAVQRHLPQVTLMDLTPSADLQTYRRTWHLQEEEGGDTAVSVMVVLDKVSTYEGTKEASSDSAPFSHQIGEIELSTEADSSTPAKQKQLLVQDMRRTLHAFMQRHPSLFLGKHQPLGKLSAYFAWLKECQAGGNKALRARS
ncbi:hypothetical protein B0A50_01749 [Salinomyces thailandicus]|uniref:Uncharacterized protein n=1 Tax=Salinomyces thailandicus TaxID=706561 RepID=A0A4U0U8N8_9PEZI|nr:hypothetical protein B0A50_01749 [Salinomyces thailandica]